MLRVRLDQDTVKKLDTVCDIKDKSRSEVVREAIELQYQRTKE
ncbi:MAG: ribbon-helix-helix protein, CopG family [Ruminococcus sp.]|nr:ribbon-helix-helix protein, CopG family [Ruminococcus sp.]